MTYIDCNTESSFDFPTVEKNYNILGLSLSISRQVFLFCKFNVLFLVLKLFFKKDMYEIIWILSSDLSLQLSFFLEIQHT